MAAEVITNRIPNQKLDRVINFIKVLEDKLKYVEEDILEQKFMSEELGDLLEDALSQASGALTPERKEYIANLIKYSLTHNQLSHIGNKKLLSLLNQVNDAEIVLLHFYSLKDQHKRNEMISKYAFIRPNLEKESGQPEGEEAILFHSYWGYLVMTSLIFGNGGTDEKPTSLGHLLLRYIGLTQSQDGETD